jgi:hypothetical protein
MEETLTVNELRLTPRLRQTLSSTNVIESSFSVVAKDGRAAIIAAFSGTPDISHQRQKKI